MTTQQSKDKSVTLGAGNLTEVCARNPNRQGLVLQNVDGANDAVFMFGDRSGVNQSPAVNTAGWFMLPKALPPIVLTGPNFPSDPLMMFSTAGAKITCLEF